MLINMLLCVVQIFLKQILFGVFSHLQVRILQTATKCVWKPPTEFLFETQMALTNGLQRLKFLKGVFSKPSGKCIVALIFLFLKLETSNFGYLFIFWFPLTVQSFSKVGQHWFKTFYKGPPFDVFWFCNLPKIHRGDPYKMFNINVVQSYWNFLYFIKIKKISK